MYVEPRTSPVTLVEKTFEAKNAKVAKFPLSCFLCNPYRSAPKELPQLTSSAAKSDETLITLIELGAGGGNSTELEYAL